MGMGAEVKNRIGKTVSFENTKPRELESGGAWPFLLAAHFLVLVFRPHSEKLYCTKLLALPHVPSLPNRLSQW